MLLAEWDFTFVAFLSLVSTLEVPTKAEEAYFKRTPHNKTLKLDQSFKYRCVSTATDIKTIKWFHNGKIMPRARNNYHINKKGTTLRFKEVKVLDRGSYHCKVVDRFHKSLKSPLAYLTVHAPAVIIDKHIMTKHREEPVGIHIPITCKAAGIPPPEIEWRRNGHLILKNQSNPHEYQTEHATTPVTLSSTLRIIVNHSANYSCSAINYPLGELSNDSVTVSIKAKRDPDSVFTSSNYVQTMYGR